MNSESGENTIISKKKSGWWGRMRSCPLVSPSFVVQIAPKKDREEKML